MSVSHTKFSMYIGHLYLLEISSLALLTSGIVLRLEPLDIKSNDTFLYRQVPHE